MKPGDIYWCDLPTTGGHEQQGRRPGIVIQDEAVGRTLPTALVVPLTTARAAIRFSGTCLIHPSQTNGLSRPSVALVFQLRAIDRKRLTQLMGSIDSVALAAIHSELDRLMGRIV